MVSITTERQLEYLRAIAELTERLGYPPTVREIGEAVRVRSSSTVMRTLEALRRKGLVEWEPEIRRTIRLTEAGRRVIQASSAAACGRFEHWTDEDYRILWMALGSFLGQASFVRGDLSPEQERRARELYWELREFVIDEGLL